MTHLLNLFASDLMKARVKKVIKHPIKSLLKVASHRSLKHEIQRAPRVASTNLGVEFDPAVHSTSSYSFVMVSSTTNNQNSGKDASSSRQLKQELKIAALYSSDASPSTLLSPKAMEPSSRRETVCSVPVCHFRVMRTDSDSML